jgi:hypothetical protein
MQRRLTFAFALALAVAVLTPRPVTACTCAGPMTPAGALEAADVAFNGIVVGFNETLVVPTSPPRPETVGYAFLVEQVVKGAPDSVVWVRAPQGGTACGIDATLGQRWVVFAFRSEGKLWTNLCSGNQLLETDVALPSAAAAAIPPLSGPLAIPETHNYVWLLLAASVGVLGLGSVYAYSRLAAMGPSQVRRRRRAGTGSGQSPG